MGETHREKITRTHIELRSSSIKKTKMKTNKTINNLVGFVVKKGQKMKILKYLSIFILILISFNCSEDKLFNSPYDSDNDPDLWKPKDLELQQINITNIKLDWDQDVKYIDGFKIDRKIGSRDWENEIITINKDKKESIDTTAIPDSLIYYRVYAYAGKNNSSYIAKSIDNILQKPTNLSFQLVNDQSVKISWTDNCSFESGYKIERKTEGGNYILIDSVIEDITNYTDEGLIYGETYYYRIKAYTNIDESDYSNELLAQTEFPTPTNLSSQLLSDQSAKISWNDNCSFESGYKIERKTEGGNYILIDSVIEDITNYTDEGLIYGETYYYRIKAFTNLNESDYTNEINFKFVFITFKKTFGGSNDDRGWSVQETSDGGFIITGFTLSYGAGYWDVWLIKTDENGNKEWDKTFGGNYNDRGWSVQETSDGGFIITGSTESYGAGDADVWLIKTDQNGDVFE